jgi:hypothetical protein
LAPLIAEMNDPVPMISTAVLCVIALVLCIMLRQP